MKKTLIALSLAAASLPAFAQKAPEPDVTLSGNFALVSDYRFRGVSQTDVAPALQGGFDLAHKGGFYLGTWASSVSEWTSVEGAGMEWDVYGGYKFAIGDIGVDIGNLYYYYPKSVGSPKPNTNEVYLGLSYGPVTFKTSFATTDYFGIANSDGTIYYDLSGSFPMSDGVTLRAHYGYVDIKNSISGSDYKLGVATDVSGYLLAVDYVGTTGDLKDFTSGQSIGAGRTKDLGKGGLVFSVTKTF